MNSISSAISTLDIDAVPSTIMAAVTWAVPGARPGSPSAPALATSAALTSGRPRFSTNRTARPLDSVSRVGTGGEKPRTAPAAGVEVRSTALFDAAASSRGSTVMRTRFGPSASRATLETSSGVTARGTCRAPR